MRKTIYVFLMFSVLAGWWQPALAEAGPEAELKLKKFTLLIYETPAEFAARSATGPVGERYWQAWEGYARAMGQEGILLGGMPLPSGEQAMSVKVRGERPVQSRGAYAEAPAGHQLGGFFMIQVPDLETALDWAAKAPSSSNAAVEVREAYPAPGI